MNNRLPWDITAADADANTDGTKIAPAAGTQIVRRLIVVMLLTAAALDLTRCGLVLAAAALTARTALGCQAGRRRAAWAASLIGVASAPQAAASGFRGPYTIPDTATVVLGILLAITLLATAGQMDRDTVPEIPACWTGEPRGDPERNRACPRPLHPTGTTARSRSVQ